MVKRVKIDNQVKAAEKPSELQAIVTADTAKVMLEPMVKEAMDAVLDLAKREIETQMQNERISLITIFGIFASIISFLTVEVQCFKAATSLWDIVGFCCVIFALLLGFNIGLDYMIKTRIDEGVPRLHWFYIGLIIGLFAIGCGAIYRGEQELRPSNLIDLNNSSSNALSVTAPALSVTTSKNRTKDAPSGFAFD